VFLNHSKKKDKMENKNTDLIAYGSYDIYIGRFLCLAYTIIFSQPTRPTHVVIFKRPKVDRLDHVCTTLYNSPYMHKPRTKFLQIIKLQEFKSFQIVRKQYEMSAISLLNLGIVKATIDLNFLLR
jgi:hypothetical protein